ncbi:hypothetical protein BLD25_02035 [Candidatus Gracilibacteria bacterium GN02-872]|nr:hypothetical protein BLD25_02035 [Candidatus Gracilibacteria bacterium GN02-872]
MRKYLAIALISVFVLSSCGKTEEIKKETNSGNSSEKTILTGKIETVKDLETYKNEKAGYEISYKNSSDYEVIKRNKDISSGPDINISNKKSGNSANVVFEDYSLSSAIKDFEQYVETSIKTAKIMYDLDEIKKEETKFAGQKAYKLTYQIIIPGNGRKLNITQYVFQKGENRVVFVLTKGIVEGTSNETEKELNEIINSFKFIK